jgi:hypothetical protein
MPVRTHSGTVDHGMGPTPAPLHFGIDRVMGQCGGLVPIAEPIPGTTATNTSGWIGAGAQVPYIRCPVADGACHHSGGSHASRWTAQSV